MTRPGETAGPGKPTVPGEPSSREAASGSGEAMGRGDRSGRDVAAAVGGTAARHGNGAGHAGGAALGGEAAGSEAGAGAESGADAGRVRLARWYRRLLWAYPPRYRRAELLDTLLEAAAPGRRRPAVREAANLLRHGMRARLGRPASRGVVVVAWLSVVVFAFLGMAGAARLSWFTARSLPDAVELEAIRQTAYPGLRPVAQTRVDDVFYYDEPTTSRALLFGADDYTPGRVETLYGSGEDLRVLLPGVRDRLVADGWQVSEVEFWDESTYGTGADLYAQRDGLTIWATDGGWQATPRLDLTITRPDPPRRCRCRCWARCSVRWSVGSSPDGSAVAPRVGTSPCGARWGRLPRRRSC